MKDVLLTRLKNRKTPLMEFRITAFERSVRCNPAPLGAGQDELSVLGVEGDVRSPTSLNRRRISPIDGGVLQNANLLVTVDPELNSQVFIVPRLGDFGDRFFGTL
jgi:hypothetical protein